jgi:hypothetical protein
MTDSTLHDLVTTISIDLGKNLFQVHGRPSREHAQTDGSSPG